MSGLVAAAITDLLKSQSFPELQEEVFRTSDMFSLFPTVPWLGGTTYPVKYQYAGNTSFQTYLEGDAPPAPGSMSYITANWPEAHYHGTGQITGHVRDYSLNGAQSAVFFDALTREVSDALRDGISKVALDFKSTSLSAPVGIQGIIDDSGTIAGLSRATYTWFKAVENAVTGSSEIALIDLDILTQDITDNVEAGNPGRTDLILTSYKQQRKMRATAGFIPGLSGSAVQTLIGAGGIQQNIGGAAPIKYGSVDIMPIHDLTNSVLLMLQRDTWKIAQLRPWTVDQLAKTDDTDKFYITAAFALVCTRPRANGKLTGATAS